MHLFGASVSHRPARPARHAPFVLTIAILLVGCVHARTVEPEQFAEEEPTSIFRPEAIQKVQDALTHEGYAIERTGKLDDKTQQAMRSYQRRNGMVETGLPDQETLRRLGLDPDEIYQRSPDEGDDAWSQSK